VIPPRTSPGGVYTLAGYEASTLGSPMRSRERCLRTCKNKKVLLTRTNANCKSWLELPDMDTSSNFDSHFSIPGPSQTSAARSVVITLPCGFTMANTYTQISRQVTTMEVILLVPLLRLVRETRGLQGYSFVRPQVPMTVRAQQRTPLHQRLIWAV